jgi:hypothetical protein
VAKAPAEGSTELAVQMNDRLALYRQGRPVVAIQR